MTPAFQSSGSAELQRRYSFPFGNLRLPRVPLGGFATSRSPLAAVAARGAVDYINDADVAACDVILELQCLFLLSLLLRTTDTRCSAICDLETFLYSPLRGNILGRTFMCVCAWARCRALTRPEGRAFLSEYGEPKTLYQAEPGTKSPAQLISTSDADEPPQKCVKARSRLQPDKPSEDLPLWASGIRGLSFCFRSAPLHSIRTPILFTVNARSARLRNSGLETFAFLLRQILRTPRFCLRRKSLRSYARFPSSESQKTPAVNAPDPTRENDDREQVLPRLSRSVDRPKHNIIGPKLCNKSRAAL